ncbi:MAG TPA: dephospho-CoA kinase, partial [Thermoanaerobaculia bacterium]|nr:dephospho-CoA kinase [Thermoanaerobaculia bacterium]
APVLRIGLTGGLASGKSTVARFLAGLGAVVFDADEIVADFYRPGGEGARAVRELFGEEALDAAGRVDRVRVAQIVFTDPARRHALEARIHPLVRREIERRFAEARERGAKVAVAEASQLLEAKTESAYDGVLLVTAPREERVRRWLEKGGEAEDAERRISSQIAPEDASRRATEVLVNDGSLDDLRQKVSALYRRWTDPMTR